MIKILNGHLRIHENILLEEVNVDIKENRIYRITGKNGAGKTVFLNSMLGLEKNFVGQIKKTYSSNDIIYIPDSPFFLDDEKIRDVLKIISCIYNEPIHNIRNYMSKLNFLESESQKISTLSFGMIKKICILPIFFTRKIYVLDEIFTGLDKDTREIVYARLKDIYNNNGTIIFVDHSNEVVDKISEITVVEEVVCQDLKVTQSISP